MTVIVTMAMRSATLGGADAGPCCRIEFQPSARRFAHMRPESLDFTHQTRTHVLHALVLHFPAFPLGSQLVHLAAHEHELILHSLIVRLERPRHFLQSDIRVDLVCFVLPETLFERLDIIGTSGSVGPLRKTVLGLSLLPVNRQLPRPAPIAAAELKMDQDVHCLVPRHRLSCLVWRVRGVPTLSKVSQIPCLQTTRCLCCFPQQRPAGRRKPLWRSRRNWPARPCWVEQEWRLCRRREGPSLRQKRMQQRRQRRRMWKGGKRCLGDSWRRC